MSDSLWNAPAIELEDIPTLGRLLEVADKDLLLREVVDIATAGARHCGATGAVDLKDLRASYARALKRMRKVKAVPASDAQSGIVLFPQYVYRVLPDCGIIAPRLAAAAIRVNDFARTCDELREGSSVGPHPLAAVAGETFHWTPWEEVLGYRVWMAGDFSRRERYRVLADVVWSMTLFGMGQSEHDEAAKADQAEIDEAAEEVFGGLAHDWSDYPSTHFCRPTAHDLGLEPTTDDYDTEYEAHFRAQAAVLKSQADRDLAGRIYHLARMLEVGYRIRRRRARRC